MVPVDRAGLNLDEVFMRSDPQTDGNYRLQDLLLENVSRLCYQNVIHIRVTIIKSSEDRVCIDGLHSITFNSFIAGF